MITFLTNFGFINGDIIFTTTYVKLFNVIYKKQYIIVVDDSSKPVFGRIEQILLNKDQSKVCLIYKKLKILNYNDHIQSYEVEECCDYFYIFPEDLHYIEPVLITIMYDNQLFVTLRYALNL